MASTTFPTRSAQAQAGSSRDASVREGIGRRPTGISGTTYTEEVPSNYEPAHKKYAGRLFSFSSLASSGRLFTGGHYRALAELLVLNNEPPSASENSGPEGAATDTSASGAFVVAHTLTGGGNSCRSRGNQIHRWASWRAMETDWDTLQGNRVVFLRGYPSPEWLSRIGGKLDMDYEFLYQHFSNPSQLAISEIHCLPPLSLVSTGTIQLTFPTIGSWDNYHTGVDLARARKTLGNEMRAFVDDLNSGNGPSLGDTVVRGLHVHDLHHFSIEQMVSIRLLQHQGSWTLLIWTDCGYSSLSRSHRGPWLDIDGQHSSATRFLPFVTHHSNSNIKRFAASASKKAREAAKKRRGLGGASLRASAGGGVDETGTSSSTPTPLPLPPLKPVTTATTTSDEKDDDNKKDDGNDDDDDDDSAARLCQTLSFLHDEFGQSLDAETASKDPFYALDEVFRLYAAAEHQFINLMEEKVHELGTLSAASSSSSSSYPRHGAAAGGGQDHQGSIVEIQMIKKLVDKHVERLRDVLDVIASRGGRGWPYSSQKRSGHHSAAALHSSSSAHTPSSSPFSFLDERTYSFPRSSDGGGGGGASSGRRQQSISVSPSRPPSTASPPLQPPLSPSQPSPAPPGPTATTASAAATAPDGTTPPPPSAAAAATTHSTATADAAVDCLHLSFAKLIRRAEAVSRGCADEIAMLGNEAMVREAQRSIEQAEAIAKVTFIAFVFVPLSFTASFFGMNLSQLNDSGPGIWAWFAMSGPTVALSLFAWLMNGARWRRVRGWVGGWVGIGRGRRGEG